MTRKSFSFVIKQFLKICPSSVKKYGLTVLMAQDAELRKYLDEVLKQMRLWIEDSKLNQVVLVVKGTRSQKFKRFHII